MDKLLQSKRFWAVSGAVVGAALTYFSGARRGRRGCKHAGAAAPAAAGAGAAAAAASPAPSDDKSDALPLPLRETKNNPQLSIEALANKMTLDDVDWEGKRVLMRVDYNVPVKEGKILDLARVTGTLDTLKYLLSQRGKNGKGIKCIVLITHMGRPNALSFKREKSTLAPVAKALEQLLPAGTPVQFLPDCIGEAVEKATHEAKDGTVILCENLRFHIEETGKAISNDEKKATVRATKEAVAAFNRGLSALGDVFVFEAFGAAHRPHASIVGVSCEPRVAGLLMKREMEYYAQVLGAPQRPFTAIIGGAKVSDKILVIENLLGLVNNMIIGGGMAYTFKKVLDGMAIGKSIFDDDGAKQVEKIVASAKAKGVKLFFPVDHIIADKFAADAKTGVTDDKTGVPDGWMALDAGPTSRTIFSEVIAKSKTILWNGPLGVYEMAPFAGGTVSAMADLVVATRHGATTIIGGGDTGAASAKFMYGSKPVAEQVSWVSTGGGSSLVLMEGKMLPGVQFLSDKKKK